MTSNKLCAEVPLQSKRQLQSRHPFDFVLPEKRIIIEVDGCFYHGHIGCRARQHLTRETVAKWVRDSAHELHAIGCGYRIIRLPECRVLAPKRPVLIASETRLLRKKSWRNDLKRSNKFAYLNLDQIIPTFLGGRLP